MSIKPLKIVEYSFQGRLIKMRFYPLTQHPPEVAEKLTEFYDIWDYLRAGRKMPSRDDITFESLKGWHANIRLTDMGQHIMSPKRNVIVGEIYKRYWGNKTMYEHVTEADKAGGDEFIGKYKQCIETLNDFNYALNIGTVPDSKGSCCKVIWLDLPLSNGSAQITHLLTALIPAA